MPDGMVEKQIEVTIQTVEFDQNSGWYAILTDKGKYTTKVKALAEEALGLVGHYVLLKFKEKTTTKPAPDGDGYRTYVDKYFNGAIESGTAPPQGEGFKIVGAAQAAQAAAQAGEGFSPPSEPRRGGMTREDQWRVTLLAGAKLAVQTMPLLPSEQRTPETQLQIALWWARWAWFQPVPSNDVPRASVRDFNDAPPSLAVVDADVPQDMNEPQPADDGIPW